MKQFVAILVFALFSPCAVGEAIIYPAEGQTAAQQETDEAECIVWARKNSGFDPLASQPETPGKVQERKAGGALRGAAGGAAVGAAVGNSDDAKKGAAAGAILGKMRQNRENRRGAQQSDTADAAAKADQAAGRDKFDRAFGACLQGRGYTVN